MVKYSALKGFYELEKTIGCGGFAKVKLATHIATGEKVAIKIMDKIQLNKDLHRVKLELNALKTLAHQHICKLYQVIETETHYFIVIEYCSGGELFDHIVEKNRLKEMESRMFFRQIVSAVAYLHSLGYAHRDIKPENILLDRHKNLKLIDFGLCAKPEGGIENPLLTSCGSPTYAAPELIQGKEYLGCEVDVWAMGVLLYALLTGYLPFYDNNVDNLYKKILSGTYDEPDFMSEQSRDLIKQMLQVDPKNRIKVKDLLSHQWLTMGVFEPVTIKVESIRAYDETCISLMALYHNVNIDEMWDHLVKWEYNYDTATYIIMTSRSRAGLPCRLCTGATKIPIRVRSVKEIAQEKYPDLGTIIKRTVNYQNLASIESPESEFNSVDKRQLSCSSKDVRIGNGEQVEAQKELLSPAIVFSEPRKPGGIRKAQKRIRSPNLDGDCSPVPAKKKTRSCSSKTSDVSFSRTPTSARKVLGSLERSFNRVRNVLTPKKQSSNKQQPVVINLNSKDVSNVSTIQCNDPHVVLYELTKALEMRDIQCEKKGIRGRVEPSPQKLFRGCSFELEICYLPTFERQATTKNIKSILRGGLKESESPSVLGIKKTNASGGESDGLGLGQPYRIGIIRKRLKGDAWCYKMVCEQILALTSKELKQTGAESSV